MQLDRSLPTGAVRRRPGRRLTAGLLACAAVAAVTLGAAQAGTGADLPAAGASGRIDVGGTSFPFTPRTCVLAGDGFVASGPGVAGGVEYVASVSSSGGVELAFGVDSDVDRPPSDRPWWVANELDHHSIEGRRIRAAARVTDSSGGLAGRRLATIEVTCPTSG